MAGALVIFVTIAGLRRVYRLRKIGLGQGVFGEYAPATKKGTFGLQRNQATPPNVGLSGASYSLIGSRKALYYDKSRRAKKDRGQPPYSRSFRT